MRKCARANSNRSRLRPARRPAVSSTGLSYVSFERGGTSKICGDRGRWDKAEEAETARAHELLRGAKRVCFLGFSYNPFNVARVNIGGPLDLSTFVFGTARGLIGLELGDARGRLAEAIGGDIRLSDTDNLDILRRNMLLG